MKKSTKPILFFAAAAVNIIFFLLCGYGKIQQPDTASYLDPFLGTVAVAVLAYGEVNLLIQLYFRSKYHMLKRRTFDMKFWRQLIVIVAYYIGTLVYLATSVMIYKAGYISVFAIVLSPLWLIGGSRTLWTDHSGEESYYLDESTKWYKVSNVMENDDVVEITCKAPDDRERTISIAKKKQQLDQ
ncbi:MAG: hypothetical protein J6C07_09775 [Lachnospiraceae bacterium]|nr:hypothetical protein [Lachnospiraceae bacterium]